MKIHELIRMLKELRTDDVEDIMVGFSYKGNGAYIVDIKPRICDDGEGNAFLDIGSIDKWVKQEDAHDHLPS